MCGIVGIVGNTTISDRKMFKNLLVMDAIRGLDSVGVAFEEGVGKSSYIKHTIPAATFVRDPKIDLDKKILSSDFLIGHNRAATKGTVNPNNAHPFKHENICGVHNGTLHDQTLLIDHKNYDVDSDNVFADILANGIAHTWAHIDGAAALVWHDEIDNTVNLIRNGYRPLWLAHDQKESTYYFASEPLMLINAAVRNDVIISEPKSVPINKHIKITCARKWDKEEKASKVSVVETDLVPFSRPVTTSHYSTRRHASTSGQSGNSTTSNSTWRNAMKKHKQQQQQSTGTNSVEQTGKENLSTGTQEATTLGSSSGGLGTINSFQLDDNTIKDIVSPEKDQHSLYTYKIEPIELDGAEHTLVYCQPVSTVNYRCMPRVLFLKGRNPWNQVGDFLTVDAVTFVGVRSKGRVDIGDLVDNPYYLMDSKTVSYKCNIEDLSPNIYSLDDGDYLQLGDFIDATTQTCSECGEHVKFFDNPRAFHMMQDGEILCGACALHLNQRD